MGDHLDQGWSPHRLDLDHITPKCQASPGKHWMAMYHEAELYVCCKHIMQ